jgi:hypothetical protein
MADINPPIGARVRITTTWPQGTVVNYEGIFTGWHEPDWELDGHFRTPYSEAGWMNGLDGSEEDPTVTVEILELPVPEEPTVDGTFVAVESEGVKTYAFSRRSAVRAAMFPDALPEYCWWWHDDTDWISWKEICAKGKPVILTPAVQANPVKLPWSLGSCGLDATVSTIGDEYDLVRVDIALGSYTRAEARQIADALLAACEVQP